MKHNFQKQNTLLSFKMVILLRQLIYFLCLRVVSNNSIFFTDLRSSEVTGELVESRPVFTRQRSLCPCLSYICIHSSSDKTSVNLTHQSDWSAPTVSHSQGKGQIVLKKKNIYPLLETTNIRVDAPYLGPKFSLGIGGGGRIKLQ